MYQTSKTEFNKFINKFKKDIKSAAINDNINLTTKVYKKNKNIHSIKSTFSHQKTKIAIVISIYNQKDPLSCKHQYYINKR